jgi:hypothetical protein
LLVYLSVEKYALINVIILSRSFVPIVSKAECIARRGIPISIVLIGNNEEITGPIVLPAIISDLFANFNN